MLCPGATVTTAVRSSTKATTVTGGAVQQKVVQTRGIATLTTIMTTSTATTTIRVRGFQFVVSGI